MVDVTGAYRVRAHAVGGGILAGRINECLNDQDFYKMNIEETSKFILNVLGNLDNGLPAGSRVETVTVGGKGDSIFQIKT